MEGATKANEGEQGKMIFAGCYVSFLKFRKERLDAEWKAVFSSASNARPFGLEKDEDLFGREAMTNMTTTGLGGSFLSAATYGAYKIIRGRPITAVGLSGMVVVGLTAGAAAGMMDSVRSRAEQQMTGPINPKDRECAAFLRFESCTKSRQCMEYAQADEKFSRMLDAFEECRKRRDYGLEAEKEALDNVRKAVH